MPYVVVVAATVCAVVVRVITSVLHWPCVAATVSGAVRTNRS